MSLFSLFRAHNRAETSRRPPVANRPPKSKPGLEVLESRVVMSTYGDPNNAAALPGLVNAAYAAGDRDIVINPGTYNLPAHSGFRLQNWQNATISAYGVTLLHTTIQGPGTFTLENCTNVTVKGAVVINAGPNSTQGQVIGVGVDANGKSYADWKIDAGYPTDSTQFNWWFNAVEANTRMLKGTGDSYNTPHQSLGNDTYRLSLGKGFVAVGDWLVERYGNPASAAWLGGCTNCTIQDVTSENGGYATFADNSSSGDHFLHVTITYGPTPAGATTPPMVANSADGINASYDQIGPDIENSVLNGVFLDDCIAVHGSLSDITSVAGKTLTVSVNGGERLSVGDPAVVYNDNGYYAEATITALQPIKGTNQEVVTLDRALAGIPATGSRLNDPRYDGAGYKIINNTLGDTRSRGIIAKAYDGLIQGNTVTNTGQAIMIGFDGEGGFSHNVQVLNNTLTNNYGGILVSGSAAIGNRNITIQGNVLNGDRAWTDILAEGTADIAISGNTIINNRNTSNNPTAIVLWNTHTVTLSDNIVGPGVKQHTLLGVDSAATGTQGVANGVIAAGTYQVSSLNSGLWLSDPNAGGLGIGQDQEAYTGGLGQHWVFAAVTGSPGKVTITNAANGLVLGIKGSTTQGTQLDLETADGSAGQQWAVVDDASDASVRLVNGLTGFLADVYGVSTSVGTQVIEWPANGGANQSWQLTPPIAVPVGPFQIANLNSGLALADPKGVGVGTNQDQETYTGALNQQWLIVAVPGKPNQVIITNVANGLVLGVKNSTAQGTQLDLETSNGSAGQRWSLVDDASHTSFHLVNALTGFVADVSAASTAPGGIVIEWSAGGAANQSWQFIPAHAVDLHGSFNQEGIVQDGATYTNGGLDGTGASLSGNLLGSAPTWNGQTFVVGAPGGNKVVQATGQTIALTAGSFSTLTLLATAVNGNQPGLTFTVTYTDGSTQTFIQGVSDWWTPQGYAGESKAITLGYRDAADGSKDTRPFFVYGYNFALNASKVVKSITLPNDVKLKVLAIDLT